jgi:hypothetical protein
LSQNYVDVSKIDAGYLEEIVLSSEAEVEHRLMVPLSPVEIFPHNPTAEELEDIGDKPWKVEPGYDLPPGHFTPGRWGMLRLRIRPIISVHSMSLVHPTTRSTVYEVPESWIIPDHAAGTVTVLPSTDIANGHLSMFLLQAISSGYEIPHIIRVRYTAGLKDVHGDYPQIPSLIKQLAVARLIEGSILPQSGSISGDGLSESFSTDISKTIETIEARIDRLRDRILGPRIVFA